MKKRIITVGVVLVLLLAMPLTVFGGNGPGTGGSSSPPPYEPPIGPLSICIIGCCFGNPAPYLSFSICEDDQGEDN